MRAEPRTALITGAASGMGRCFADRLLAAGYVTYGTSRAPEDGPPTAFPLLRMDVRDDASVRECIETVSKRCGHIDVLVNNAGVSLVGSLEDTSTDEVRTVLETNVLGPIRVIQATLPQMRARAAGHIVNIGSIGGQIGLPYRSAYSASKAALGALTEALSMEVARFGITVTLIEPGDFRTRIHTNRAVAHRAVAGTAYDPDFSAVARSSFAAVAAAPDPVSVAELLLHIIESRRPSLRYRVGATTERLAVAAKRLLPDRFFETLILRHYMATVRPSPRTGETI